MTTAAKAEGLKAVDALEVAREQAYFGELILVRGGFGVFSRGLDGMAAKLKKRGLNPNVISHVREDSIVDEIIANQKKYGSKPVVLIGHSWGANSVMKIAAGLRKAKIKVDYVASFAATNPLPAASNIRKVTNYYFSGEGWGKPVRRGRGFRGNLTNVDLSERPGINHFNIDEDPTVQKQVIQNVVRFMPRKRSS
ncbi:alpha/beta hydrolase [Ahrensia sp. R2A130]|uniref:alpha/beta hydrolase n=1 Tax=Ahrensia sp. R2A130 TaxID=744979 RepID=UPI0012EACA5E|nr:alpha/beta hydrolase [Ahrensia sp. R2A130]